ncbi:MAG: hypothetical protein LBQ97_07915 [Fusobacteriaceae bacterium]|jgi:type I restriction enzyme R subunit|nr:hypothetical protein [Fusobacteriaceae bacterium]
MPTNFEYLKHLKQYELFSDVCIETENILSTSLALSVLGCYEALTFAVRWVYAVENLPGREKYKKLDQLIADPLFKSLVDEQVILKLPYIVKLWKFTLQSEDELTKDDAVLALSIVFEFVLWIDYVYGLTYTEREFREEDIPVGMITVLNKDLAFEKKSLVFRDEAVSKRLEDQISGVRNYFLIKKDLNRKLRTFRPADFYKMSVRSFYIDLDLKFAGWDPERDIKKDVEYEIRSPLEGREKVAIDYLLLGKDGLPLAIIEGRYSLEDLEYGRKQAVRYAGHIGSDTRRIPAVFLVHGGSFYYMDSLHATPRKIAGIFGLEDLHRIKNLKKSKKDLITVAIDNRIAPLPYEVEAIKAVTSDFIENKTKSLIFMTSGSAQGRVLAGLIDLMSRANYVTSVLYLIGRDVNLKYTKKMLKRLILSMSIGEYSKYADDAGRLLVSTPEDIVKELGHITGSGERYFSPGEFDLIVVDNVCRNTIISYGEIFRYFDSAVVGISPLPKDDLDPDVFRFFGTNRDDSRYIYHYEEALQQDNIIVPYSVVTIGNKVLENNMAYDQLTTENKNLCEETYTDDPAKMLNWVPNDLVDNYLMNANTIDMVLKDIMKSGIKDSKSESVGKTVIFAQNRNHGERILQRFRLKYPDAGNDFIRLALFDDRDSLDDFLDPERNVNILVDVGFASMGMIIPEILNVVLFKKIYSKFEFHQMMSVGNVANPNITCIEPKEGVYVGKKRYYIFDYLGNFDFFSADKKSEDNLELRNISEDIFVKCVGLLYHIQHNKLTDKDYMAFSDKLTDFVTALVKSVTTELTNVHLQFSHLEKYTRRAVYDAGLTAEDKSNLEVQIAPLVRIKGDEYSLQFDNFMYGIMLAQMESKPFVIRAKKQLSGICHMLHKHENIPEIKNELDYIKYFGSSKFIDNSSILELEMVRTKLRKLIKFIFATDPAEKETPDKPELPKNKVSEPVVDDAQTESGEKTENASELTPEERERNLRIREYKERITDYIRTNPNQAAIWRMRVNYKMTEEDHKSLARVFTKRLGTKKDYEDAYGNLQFGLLVRQVAKIEAEQVKVAFFPVTNDKTLSDEQKNFLTRLRAWVVDKGYIENCDAFAYEIEEFADFTSLFDEARQEKILSILRTIYSNALFK